MAIKYVRSSLRLQPASHKRQDGSLQRQRRLLLLVLISSALAILLLGKIASHTEAAKVEAAPNLNSLFYQANTAYQNGEFLQAAQTYEEILTAGYASGNLYYNLANAYYRNGQRGLALLNYLRAKQLIPRDPDLRANLEHVLSELQLPEESQGLIQWMVGKLTDWLTVREMAVVASVFLTMLTIALLFWLYCPRGRRWARSVAVLTGLCLVLTLIAVGIGSVAVRGDRAIVVVKEAIVRFEPSANGATHYTLNEGASAVVEGSREGWVQVRRADGKKGWVQAEEVQELDL